MQFKIGITGITGPIGHSLCKALNESYGGKLSLTALYRPISSCNQEQVKRFEKSQEIFASAGIKWVEMKPDLDPLTMQNVMQQCDYFFHLAAWSAQKIPDDKAAEVLKTNVIWPAILTLLAQNSTTNLFLASTQMVYLPFVTPTPPGERTEAINEEVKMNLSPYQSWMDNVIPQIMDFAGKLINHSAPQAPLDFAENLLRKLPVPNGTQYLYGLSKILAEKIVTGLWDYNLKGLAFRFAGVFGPSPVENPQRTVPLIIGMIRRDGPVKVMPWTNNFIYSGDLTPSLIEAINSTNLSKDVNTIHFSEQRPYSLSEIAAMLISISNKPLSCSIVEGVPARQDFVLDTSRAENILKLKHTPIEKALQETFNAVI